MEIKFGPEAWEQYTGWQTKDKKTIKRIHDLLKDITLGNPYEGIGKPEARTGNLSGFWSRRIDDHNRLVYCIQGENEDICQVFQCKGHYGK